MFLMLRSESPQPAPPGVTPSGHRAQPCRQRGWKYHDRNITIKKYHDTLPHRQPAMPHSHPPHPMQAAAPRQARTHQGRGQSTDMKPQQRQSPSLVSVSPQQPHSPARLRAPQPARPLHSPGAGPGPRPPPASRRHFMNGLGGKPKGRDVEKGGFAWPHRSRECVWGAPRYGPPTRAHPTRGRSRLLCKICEINHP